MRVLVCGGRDYDDRAEVLRVIREVGEIEEIIEGGAKGADSLARSVGEELGIPVFTIPAEWSKYGRAAGPIRNKEMLEKNPDLVIAFPGGKGTENMVKIAKEAGVKVYENN